MPTTPNAERPEKGDAIFDRGGSFLSTVRTVANYLEPENCWGVLDADLDIIYIVRYPVKDDPTDGLAWHVTEWTQMPRRTPHV